MNSISLRVLVAAIGAVAAFGAGWSINGWRLGQQIARIERDQKAAAEAASETARLKERAWNNQLEVARNEATKRETVLRADAATARQSADGLRGDLAEFRRKLPGLTSDAVRQYADTLGDVLSDCTDKYRSMAKEADRHASDKRTLMEAWPK